MSEIPKHIGWLSAALIDALEAMPSDGNLRLVDEAIFAAEKRGMERERERCAGVAEHYAQQWDTGGQDGEGSIGFHACMQVADHIRGS